MIVLDASLLIAHFWPRGPHQQAATDFLANPGSSRLAIHPMNLAEVLVGGVSRGRADDMMSDVAAMGVEILAVDPGEPLRLATLRFNTGLKLPDCCALDAALRKGNGLATFDDRLRSVVRDFDLAVFPHAVVAGFGAVHQQVEDQGYAQIAAEMETSNQRAVARRRRPSWAEE